MADVKIRITGEDDSSGALNTAANSLEKLPTGAQQATGSFKDLGQQILNIGSTGQMSFSSLALSIGAAIPVAGGLMFAIGAIVDAAGKAAGAFGDWVEQVKNLSVPTGMTMEFASVVAYGEKLAGLDTSRLGMSLGLLADRAVNAADSLEKAGIKGGAAFDKMGTQMDRLSTDHATRLIDVAEKLADQLDGIDLQRTRTSHDYYQQLGDQAEAHAQRVHDLNKNLADELQSIADRNLDIDAKAEKERAGIKSEFANANTAMGKAALQAELDALDGRTKKEKDKNKEKDDRRIADINEQISREDAAYAKQQQREKESFDQRMGDFTAMQDKMTKAAQETVDKENLSYKRGLEDRTAAMQAAGSSMASITDKTATALGKLNITLADFIKLTPDQQFKTIIDGLNNIPDPAKRAQAAIDLFGRFGAISIIEFADVVRLKGWGPLTKDTLDSSHMITTAMSDEAEAARISMNNMKGYVEGGAIKSGEALSTLASVLEKVAKGDWPGAAVNFGVVFANVIRDLFQHLQLPLAGGLFAGRDFGGPVNPGMPYQIGRPEIFVPNQGGQIIPLGTTNNNMTLNIHSNASRENLMSDFYIAKALTGASS